MDHHPGRRSVLLALGGIALGAAAGCDAPSSAVGAPAVSAGPSQVNGQSLAAVPANESFAFAGDGGSSPITADYWLGRYQVTNAQYQQYLSAVPGASAPGYWSDATYPAGKADHPVLYVSAVDAEAFCAWLTSTSGDWTFRLPTEAEWENAARGPQSHTYPWGDQAGTTYADGTLTSNYNYNAVVSAYYLAKYGTATATYNHKSSTRYGQSEPLSSILAVDADGGVRGWIDHDTWTGFVYTDLFTALGKTGGYTSAVGAYPAGASPYGCHDMAGNAFEWTSSLITASNGAEAGKQVNAVRGGSWYSTGRSCRTNYRGEGRAGSGGYNTVGFRVAAVRA
ncbi:SUMF1/EgtB/PvdO family nonheme iron enzyme [Actinoplanes sp. ATCC 53533]|uniref:formylglycine-generating enzyme family protein n=1 Tax=Actinoplanes sp. ATCC 53533 TaxID=1288362 RepID=UPI000F7ABDCB|nr:SUMF1/EgtB/PvdO family nonheme iron enzyme [Actinoplanes sp. ATCC 53533]